jgi:hypothetical protein
VKTCPYCPSCGCGRETGSLPDPVRELQVLNSVLDLVSKDRSMLYLDPLYLAQELVYHKYFSENSPPLLSHVGSTQDFILLVEE